MNNDRSEEFIEPAKFVSVSRLENYVVLGIIAFVVVVTAFPYTLAYSVSNNFVGQVYNIVDFSVYLSWTRQAADGHFSSLNLFTTLPQHGYLFNALFLVLGAIVRLTHLPIPIVFMLARVGGAVVLLRLAYRLCQIAFPTSVSARLFSFALIALSSGFGWMSWPKWADINPGKMTIDTWQPEAFTFLSIYTSFLFVVATIFILTAMYNLIRSEQTGQFKYAVYAGICGMVLGNIHSYDVLHLSAGWGLYLLAMVAVERKFDRDRWLRAVVVGLMTLPTTAYEYWVFQHEPAFHARALTKTPSASPYYEVMGYGFVFILAAVTILLLITRRDKIASYFQDRMTLVWVVAWAVGGFVIIYLPVAFQRKMAMGEHIPLCLLAGAAGAYLTSSLAPKIQAVVLTAIVLATFPTNALFLVRDVRHIETNKSEISSAHPFLTNQQLEVLQWLDKNTVRGDAILALPPIGQFVPGYCDRAVWVGHWSETPSYGAKLFKLMTNLSTNTPDEVRYQFFVSTGTDYLVYPVDASQMPIHLKHTTLQLSDFSSTYPPYLQKVYETPVDPSNVQTSQQNGYLIFKILR